MERASRWLSVDIIGVNLHLVWIFCQTHSDKSRLDVLPRGASNGSRKVRFGIVTLQWHLPRYQIFMLALQLAFIDHEAAND